MVGVPSSNAQPRLEVVREAAATVDMLWPASETGYVLESTPHLRADARWEAVADAPTVVAGRWRVRVSAGEQSRFFRLRRALGPVGTRVLQTSPGPGETSVAVTRESVFRLSAPLAPDTVLTTAELFAEFGGRRILSRAELSSDGRTATLFYLENLPSSSRIRVTLDGSRLLDTAGRALDADGDGQPGGVGVLEFDTAGTTGLPGTAVIGRVFASERNPDGSNRPLENATITVDGAEETLRTTTDATGMFTLSPAPAGRFFVHVDGRTVVGSQWPGGAYYPFVGKAWEAVAGVTNNLAGGSGEIYLPRIGSDTLVRVSSTEETPVTFAPSILEANPRLAGVEVRVPANSLFADNGVRGGSVGIAPVPPDRLPEPLPAGLSFPLVITVQTDGGSNFDVPVPVRFPNLPDPVTGVTLRPGEKTALWSFNHDTGRWEIQGPATISADGLFAVSDPGVGIRQPGWHGVMPSSEGVSETDTDTDEDDPDESPDIDPCRELKLKAQFAGADCAVDMSILPLDLTYLPGCALGAALGSWRTARDCMFLDLDDCPTSLINNRFNADLGCVPVVGGYAGAALCTYDTEKALEAWDKCRQDALRNKGPALHAAGAAIYDPDPRLVEARRVLDLQSRLNEALKDLSDLVMGSSDWSSLNLRTEEDSRRFLGLIQDWVSAMAGAGPGGRAITPEERAALLQRPLPPGLNLEDVEALADRFGNLGPGGLDLPATQENLRIYDRALELLAEVDAQGWTSAIEGEYRAQAIFSELMKPRPPRTGSQTVGDPLAVFPSGPHHYVLVNLENRFVQRGRLNAETRLANLILAPNTLYRIAYFMSPEQPGTLGSTHTQALLGMAVFRSQAAGQRTRIPYAGMIRDEGNDTDQDGLSDLAEQVVGTSETLADSDQDGIPDGQEVALNTNPLDGVGLPVGVVSVSPAPGTAYDVAVANGIAVVAASQGLAVFDVTNPSAPLQLAVIPGTALAVALRGNLALASSNEGVRLYDLSMPSAPRLVWERVVGRMVGVALDATSAFSVGGFNAYRFDLATGAVSQRSTGSVQVDNIIARGNLVYAIGRGSLLVFRDGDAFTLLSRIDAPGFGPGTQPRRVFLDANRLYATQSFGFNVFDLGGDPERPVQLTDIRTQQAGWRQFVPLGSGLALAAVGPNSPEADGPHDVSFYRLSVDGQSIQFVSTLVTPGSAYAVAAAGGRAFVADGTSGLTVLNYLTPDLAGIPPTAVATVDSDSIPPRVEAGSRTLVTAVVSDDVAVRRVEFILNDEIAAIDESYPFETFPLIPPVTAGQPSLRIRVRAEDMAGNIGVSPELTVNVVPDATPPRIRAFEPAPDSTIPFNGLNTVTVFFQEPVASPFPAGPIALRGSGLDGFLDTPDDVDLVGEVRWIAADNALQLQLPEPMAYRQYRATLAAGFTDLAGNPRPAALSWTFETGAPPRVRESFPPKNYVRVGGMLDAIEFQFDQPVPASLLANYQWTVTRQEVLDSNGNTGPAQPVAPLTVLRSTDGRTVSLRTDSPLPPGYYRVAGNGPLLAFVLWDFYFRNVPNEAISTDSFSGTRWKHPPGPGVDDELIVNLPGQVAPVETQGIRSLIAHTDIAFNRQQIQVPTPILLRGALRISSTSFGPGSTDVHGPVTFLSSAPEAIRIGAHTLNLHGGGEVRTSVTLEDPEASIVNRPGSSLVITSAGSLVRSSTGTPVGRLVNLGVLRSIGTTGIQQIDGPLLRNEGLTEAASGTLRIFRVENEGTLHIAGGARLMLPSRTRGGASSRMTGDGDVEFGEYDSARRRVLHAADAELRGDFELRGKLTLVAGSLSFWRTLTKQEGVVELLNNATLRCLAPSAIRNLALTDGNLVFNSDGEIANLTIGSRADIQVATRVRVGGDTFIRQGLDALGPGVLEFAGTTVVSNGTQNGGAYVGNATLLNSGTWRQAINNTQGSFIARVNDNDQLGTGVFENTGLFEMTTERPFSIEIPFRNRGRVVLARTTVSVDANPAFRPPRSGAYLPQPGAELVLNNTTLDHNAAGTLDLAAGTLRGTGNIQAVAAGSEPKVINRGVLRPGHPTGTLVIRASGGFEQTASGEIILGIGAAGRGFLRFDRTAAALDGTLTLELLEGFSPPVGQSFRLLDYSSRTGEFAQVNLPDPGPDRRFELVYESDGLTARVVAR